MPGATGRLQRDAHEPQQKAGNGGNAVTTQAGRGCARYLGEAGAGHKSGNSPSRASMGFPMGVTAVTAVTGVTCFFAVPCVQAALREMTLAPLRTASRWSAQCCISLARGSRYWAWL